MSFRQEFQMRLGSLQPAFAEQAAGAIALDFCLRKMGAADSLRARATVVLGGPADGPWDSPEDAARARTATADLLDAGV